MKETALLEKWYLDHARKLPWRQTTNPYAIWISEVMLQQTQVAVVIPYYERFLKKFPTVTDLAESAEADVLGLWSGLGYYSRGKNLRLGAQYLRKNTNGTFPKTREDILQVPGIGPYTAGAILSIAFDLPVPLVDGNVQRVFSRLYGFQKPIESGEAKIFFWEKAGAWVKDARSPRVLNQALMELGATVCKKADPLCHVCPLQKNCEAFRLDLQNSLPVRKPRRKAVELWWIGAVLESEGEIFLKQNSQGEWWSGLWDLPRLEVKNKKDLSDGFQKLLETFPAKTWTALNHQKHTVTHHRLHIAPYHLKLGKRSVRLKGSWFSQKELKTLAVSSLVRKTLSSL